MRGLRVILLFLIPSEMITAVVDYSLDDEFDGDRNRNEVLAHYIAIGHRSLLQLDVHLELAEQHKPLPEVMPAIKTEPDSDGAGR